MAQSPEAAARSRYAQNFRSSIFEPLPTPQGPAFVPAGKRRDQTTSEMFGSYDEKDLKGMPKTFIPKDDAMTAREKKMQFLSSEVLPCSSYEAAGGAAAAEYQPQDSYRERPMPPPEGDYYDDEEAVDANLRRQMELQSKLFGRATPHIDAEQLHDRSRRLTPSDFKWHSHPEAVHQQGGQGVDHRDRAFQEKCSGLFDHRSPQTLSNHFEAERQAREEETSGDAKRRANVYYSDLFGRAADYGEQSAPEGERRARHMGNAEDKLIVHQDWTDSKTELLQRGSPRPEHPALRKSDELHQARIFGPRSEAWSASTERQPPVTHDNSQKLKGALGRTTQEIHQAHLRTSITPDEFYEEAHTTKHWEVVELHISGLRHDADDGYVRNLCQGFDLQIVKVNAEIDPVRNLCKGRAKVMVRYNPKRDSIAGLVRKLEASRLRVEL